MPRHLRDARRTEILRIAIGELRDHGYEKTSMTRIAALAGASKETLYSWFGNKEELFAAAIEVNADDAAKLPDLAVSGPPPSPAEVPETLLRSARGLIDLPTGPDSIALNRAANSSPQLAEVLTRAGRERAGSAMVRYLERLSDQGMLHIDDAHDASTIYFGLVNRDSQIRALLGGSAPDPRARAEQGVDAFLNLFGKDDTGRGR
ncbi:TetR/AcrR family transcriptional regulator [Corynebacterium pacaense]|uniref:TetR/AcrR family transcriptional regulator n=1 Tax=Corynebacterium pacaense TaxID=1816684 RepID=UPI0015C44C5D|nr:TetR/AcrR family transcriptional regulator [Corynebacterium pacaense]